MDLYSDRYWTAELRDSVIRLTRTGERIDSLESMKASLEALSATLRTARDEHSIRGLLLDTRSAPPRNDDDFETLTSTYRQELQSAFGRVATLVSTQVGKLQLSRLDRRDGTHTMAFEDENEALAYILS